MIVAVFIVNDEKDIIFSSELFYSFSYNFNINL